MIFLCEVDSPDEPPEPPFPASTATAEVTGTTALVVRTWEIVLLPLIVTTVVVISVVALVVTRVEDGVGVDVVREGAAGDVVVVGAVVDLKAIVEEAADADDGVDVIMGLEEIGVEELDKTERVETLETEMDADIVEPVPIVPPSCRLGSFSSRSVASTATKRTTRSVILESRNILQGR